MVQAVFNKVVIAESNDTVVVDRKHYFPENTVKKEYFSPTDYRTTCPWKGEAHYYDLEANGKKQIRAAFYYPQPSREAQMIAGRIAFYHGVDVIEKGGAPSGGGSWYKT